MDENRTSDIDGWLEWLEGEVRTCYIQGIGDSDHRITCWRRGVCKALQLLNERRLAMEEGMHERLLCAYQSSSSRRNRIFHEAKSARQPYEKEWYKKELERDSPGTPDKYVYDAAWRRDRDRQQRAEAANRAAKEQYRQQHPEAYR